MRRVCPVCVIALLVGALNGAAASAAQAQKRPYVVSDQFAIGDLPADAALPTTGADQQPLRLENLFFAFDNGVGRGRLAPNEQAQLLADLGYDGIGYTGTQNIPEMLEALQSRGLKMFSTYVRLDLRPDGASYEQGLPEAIRHLKGHGTIIWLHVHGGKPSSDELDTQAVAVLREIAAMAQESRIRVALYPHTGMYVATTRDAVRLARKVDRRNVGASFNLCHFLKVEKEDQLRQTLQIAAPYLFAVSLNGADRGDTNAMQWNRLIQTLDRGTFDVYGVLKMLKQLGYDGPVGLQCYNIPGDPRENLKHSIEAWHRFVERTGKIQESSP